MCHISIGLDVDALEKLQKNLFFSGPATKALPPPTPSSLVATKNLPEFFLELQNTGFFLSGQALIPPPPS